MENTCREVLLSVSLVGSVPKWDSDVSGIVLKVSLYYSAPPQCFIDPSGHITVMRAAPAIAVRAHSTPELPSTLSYFMDLHIQLVHLPWAGGTPSGGAQPAGGTQESLGLGCGHACHGGRMRASV